MNTGSYAISGQLLHTASEGILIGLAGPLNKGTIA
jgi:hypothetical protein